MGKAVQADRNNKKRRKVHTVNNSDRTVQKKKVKKNNAVPKNRTSTKSKQVQRIKSKKKKKKQSPVLHFIFNLLFYGFILFIVIGSAIFGMSKNDNKSVLGYRTFGVLTDSMVPRDKETQKGGFAKGDIIIVKDIQGDAAEIGDIITFRPSMGSKAFLTHRVKDKMDQLSEVKGVYYITQGDANEAEDVPISAEQVVGKKVFMIPKIGGILNFVKENLLVSMVFLLSVFGFITVLRYYFFSK